MAKSTKQRSDDKGKTTAKPVRRKVTVGKMQEENVSAEPKVSRKKGTTKKAAKKRATPQNGVTKKEAVETQRPAKKTVARKASAKKKAVSKHESVARSIVKRPVTSAERHQMIAEVAYLIAESKGFLSDERENWFHAETAVDCLLTREGVIVTG